MAYGIEVTSLYGKNLIDGIDPLYSEIASGTVAVNSSTGGGAYEGTVPIPGGYTNVVIAYSPPVGAWLSYWREVLYCSFNTGPVNVPYKIFAPADQVSPSTDQYGLRIYNAAGGLVFDSGIRTFNVVKNTVFQIPATTTESSAFSVQSGSWLIPSTAGLKGHSQVDASSGAFLTGFIRNNGNGSYSKNIFEFTPGPIPTGGSALWESTGSVVEVKIT